MSGAFQRMLARSAGRKIVIACATLAIVLGVAARVDHLESRLLWQDEAFSMLRITGHTEAELYGAFNGRITPVSAFLKIDQLAPGRGLGVVFASLGEEPQRGPAFYGAARIWAGLFGDGTGAMRLLPALLGVVGIALAFALGCELAPGAGIVLASLVALSPIEIHFSTQLREYVAIADATLLASWMLLRGLRYGGALQWSTYGVALVVGFYVSPIFLSVLLAHVAVVAGAVRRDGIKTALSWLVATIIALALLAPWLTWSIIASHSHTSDVAWLRGSYTPKAYATKWLFNVGAVFFDAEFARTILGVVLAPILAIVALAYIRLGGRGVDPLSSRLAAGLSLCTLMPLVLLDVVDRSHVEAVARYQMPTWLGVDIVVALLIARGLTGARRAHTLALAAFAFLLACGAFSLWAARPYPVWWDDNEHINEELAAGVIANQPRPTLVIATKADDRAPYALVLAHYLPPGTELLLVPGAPPLPSVHRGSTYLFLPSSSELAELRRECNSACSLTDVSPSMGIAIPSLTNRGAQDSLAPIRPDNLLWRVSRPINRR